MRSSEVEGTGGHNGRWGEIGMEVRMMTGVKLGKRWSAYLDRDPEDARQEVWPSQLFEFIYHD